MKFSKMKSDFSIPLVILFLMSLNLVLILTDSSSLESFNTVNFEFSVAMENTEDMENHNMHMIHHFVESGKENPVLQVHEGYNVTIFFENTDNMMVHDFVIPEFGIQTKLLEPGEYEKIEFEATKSGEFDYFCSIHSDQMNGSIIITM